MGVSVSSQVEWRRCIGISCLLSLKLRTRNSKRMLIWTILRKKQGEMFLVLFLFYNCIICCMELIRINFCGLKKIQVWVQVYQYEIIKWRLLETNKQKVLGWNDFVCFCILWEEYYVFAYFLLFCLFDFYWPAPSVCIPFITFLCCFSIADPWVFVCLILLCTNFYMACCQAASMVTEGTVTCSRDIWFWQLA